jgi:hypothetical protein
MHDRPHVSLLMASYNHAEFISAAIESVFSQDYPAWELIIADDASTDNTRAVLSRFDDPRIKTFFFDVNRQFHMRNFALERAQGEYVAILNSDDLYLAGKLAKQVAYLESHPSTAAVFTRMNPIDEAGDTIPGHRLPDVFDVPNRPRHRWLEHFFFSGNCLCLPSAMIRRKALQAAGRFDPGLVQMSDFDLWIRLCLKWDIWILPEVLTAMRVLENGRNLSAPSVATSNRSMLEHARLIRHYLSPAGIGQATEIFPQLRELLPTATDEWKRFLICQMAGGQRNPAKRWFAHQNLQQLIADDEARGAVQSQNPRLMRNFILSEGAAAIRPGARATHWVIYLPDTRGAYSGQRAYRFWREFGEQTLSFSVPNPRLAGRLRVDPSNKPIAFRFRGMRLYDQQSGALIWQLDRERVAAEIGVAERVWLGKCGDDWSFRAGEGDARLLLPELDLAAVPGKWLDLEIDMAGEVE